MQDRKTPSTTVLASYSRKGGEGLGRQAFRTDVKVAEDGSARVPAVTKRNCMEFSRKLTMRTKITLLLAGAAISCLGQTPVQFNVVPSRSIGHAKLQLVTGAPNFVEGRELNSPQGVAVDGQGNIFIADTTNNGVRKVTSAGTISTVAGGSFAAYDGDGAAATAAHINFPQGIASRERCGGRRWT